MKFLVFMIVLVVLVAGLATAAAAATLGYLDVVSNGSVDKDGSGFLGPSSEKTDLKISIISAGTLIQDKYKLGAEYGIGSIAGTAISPKEDVKIWSIKGGYRLVNAKAFKLDAIVAPLDLKTDSSQLKVILGGVDVAQYFSTKMFLTASYVLGSGSNEKEGLPKDDSVPVHFFRAKFHYLLNDQVGLVAGYTSLKYKIDAVHPLYGHGAMDVTMGGPSLGLVYIF